MGNNSFAPYLKQNTTFVVKNITSDKDHKTIFIFQYPINYNQTRDLLQIPGVGEADIRASLLKGQLNHKIRAKDIAIVDSDIDLLQFNVDQLAFLQAAGITNGLQISGGQIQEPFLFKQNIHLSGNLNGINRIFNVPGTDKFINGTYLGSSFSIQIFHNGRELVETDDYILSESGGAGTGYDTIIITSFAPTAQSTLIAHYVVKGP